MARAEEAEVIVVGLPLHLDGRTSPSAKAAIADARLLATLVDVPVEMHDERLTTVTADRRLAEAGLDGRERRKLIDAAAAAVMLQSWLDGRANGASDE